MQIFQSLKNFWSQRYWIRHIQPIYSSVTMISKCLYVYILMQVDQKESRAGPDWVPLRLLKSLATCQFAQLIQSLLLVEKILLFTTALSFSFG